MLIVGLGLFVGLILGLTGASGAILAVPLLIFALKWDVASSLESYDAGFGRE